MQGNDSTVLSGVVLFVFLVLFICCYECENTNTKLKT